MSAPTRFMVRSVDEKPLIQALEQAQGYLKLPNGRAMIGQSHDGNRRGTSPDAERSLFWGWTNVLAQIRWHT